MIMLDMHTHSDGLETTLIKRQGKNVMKKSINILSILTRWNISKLKAFNLYQLSCNLVHMSAG